MHFRDFRIGWRLLVKEPAYSAAAIVGLAIGFAVCILLLGFVRYAFTYNAHLQDSDRIFAVKERRNMLPRPDWRVRGPSALRDVALAAMPGVAVTRSTSVEVAARNGAGIAMLDLQVVDANYLAFFGKRVLAGNAAEALARPDALVLSRTKAGQLFGRDDALGKVLHIDGVPFEIQAILDDEPGNSTVGFDALVGVGKHSWDQPQSPAGTDSEWNELKQLYIKLPPGADPALLASALQQAVTVNVDARMPAAWHKRAGGARLTDIAVARLTELYFDKGMLDSRTGARYGNRPMVLALGALALFILVLAATNYVNLAAVRTLSRQREIGVRKALGAGPARLAGQLIAESLLVCLLATLAGLLMAWLAAPLFGELVNRPIAGMLDLQVGAAGLLLGTLTGVLAALYPAWIAMRMPSSYTLNERSGGETGGALRLRRLVTVFQVSSAICLIGVTVAVLWQSDYASRADPGFDPAPFLVLTLPGDPEPVAAQALRAELERLPQVAGVAVISDAVGRDDNKLVQMLTVNGADARIEIKPVSPNFFELLGVAAQAGRVFGAGLDQPDSASVVLNAAGARLFGFARPQDAVGKLIGDGKQIVGIAPDLRYRTLRERPEAMMYVVRAVQPVLLVKAAGEPAAAIDALGAAWQHHYPQAVFDVASAHSIFAGNYADDRRLGKILTTASVVATILAGFGIYVLSAYSVRRRAREIVLRKIHGATGGDIGRLVVRESIVLLAIGALIGIPLAMLAIERYLATFVERAPMGAWPAGAALACVAMVAAAAIARHTVRAMRMLPAAALRT